MIDLLTEDTSKTTTINAKLNQAYEDAPTNFLRDNKDIFTWKLADIPGVPWELAEQKLELKPGSKPIK